MSGLSILHTQGTDPPQFQILSETGDIIGPVVIQSPVGYPVLARPGSHFMGELKWYLENFLDFPYSPEIEHADRVLDALNAWGEAAFISLFRDTGLTEIFDPVKLNDRRCTVLRIVSSDPMIQSWPWEALRDPATGYLARICGIERSIGNIDDRGASQYSFTNDAVNILLITARPFVNDAPYQSISGPLVELIEKESFPAKLHILRPPTLSKLEEHLRERQEYYHILHFDGHGIYENGKGNLVFESDGGGGPVLIMEELAAILQVYTIPCVMLNACQSATHNDFGSNIFSSVATALLKVGVDIVIAMAYSLYIDGAKIFFRVLYKHFLESGNMSTAVREGRIAMMEERFRSCQEGLFELSDWLVPVLYKNDYSGFVFNFNKNAMLKDSMCQDCLQGSLNEIKKLHGFVSRDKAILDMERAIRCNKSTVLVYGIRGGGKSFLVKSFIYWLARTDGLGKGVLWLDFQHIYNIDDVLELLSQDFALNISFHNLKVEEKFIKISQYYKDNSFLIVWENFQIVSGVSGLGVRPQLSANDRKVIVDFMDQLIGGKTKIVIISCRIESWLDIEKLRTINLGCFTSHERHSYCGNIFEPEDKKMKDVDKDFLELMRFLDGHPLSMRIVLPLLNKYSVKRVLSAFREKNKEIDLFGESNAKNKMPFDRIQYMSSNFKSLAYLVSLHSSTVEGRLLSEMLKYSRVDIRQKHINLFLSIFQNIGIIDRINKYMFKISPIGNYYLSRTIDDMIPLEKRQVLDLSFIRIFSEFSDFNTKEEYIKQSFLYQFHRLNLLKALENAKREHLIREAKAVLQFMANLFHHTAMYVDAVFYYGEYIALCREESNELDEAIASHQMGLIYEKKGDHEKSKLYINNAMRLDVKNNNIKGEMIEMYHLAVLEMNAGNMDLSWAMCSKLYNKLIATKKMSLYDEIKYILGGICHLFGVLSQKKKKFLAARSMYNKSIAVKQGVNDLDGEIITLGQIALLYYERKKPNQSLSIFKIILNYYEKKKDYLSIEKTYINIGMVLGGSGNRDEAIKFFYKSLKISEELKDSARAINTYRRLAVLEESRGNIMEARFWAEKAMTSVVKSS